MTGTVESPKIRPGVRPNFSQGASKIFDLGSTIPAASKIWNEKRTRNSAEAAKTSKGPLIG